MVIFRSFSLDIYFLQKIIQRKIIVYLLSCKGTSIEDSDFFLEVTQIQNRGTLATDGNLKIFLTGGNKIYTSLNDSANFELIPSPIDLNGYAFDRVILKANQNYLYTMFRQQDGILYVFRTSNYGINWSILDQIEDSALEYDCILENDTLTVFWNGSGGIKVKKIVGTNIGATVIIPNEYSSSQFISSAQKNGSGYFILLSTWYDGNFLFSNNYASTWSKRIDIRAELDNIFNYSFWSLYLMNDSTVYINGSNSNLGSFDEVIFSKLKIMDMPISLLENGIVITQNQINLEWTPYIITDTLEIQISNDPLFNNLVYDSIFVSNGFTDFLVQFDNNYSGDSAKYYYRIRGIQNEYLTRWSPIKYFIYNNPTGAVPFAEIANYFLSQSYPNPFNPTTHINYSLQRRGFVTLKVYNSIGELVSTLINEEKTAGNYSVSFNASDLPSGIYFYRLTAGNFNQTRKMLLLR